MYFIASRTSVDVMKVFIYLFLNASKILKLLKIAYDINSVKRSSLNQFYTQNALVVPSFINNPYLVIHPSTLEEKEQPWSCSASKKKAGKSKEVKLNFGASPSHAINITIPDPTTLFS